MTNAERAIGSIDEIGSVAGIGNPTPRESGAGFARGDSLFVRGWIAVPTLSEQPRSFGISVDDRYDLSAVSGIPRADVAASLGDARLANVGFMAFASTHHLSPGTHTLRCFATGVGPEERFEIDPFSFSILEPSTLMPSAGAAERDRFRGHVDEIRVDFIGGIGDERGLSIFVRGWACDMHLGQPAADVFGIIPDGSCGRAVIGFARPDIVIALGDAAYENCGYRLRIFTESKSFGREDLRVTALSADRTRQGNFWNGSVG